MLAACSDGDSSTSATTSIGESCLLRVSLSGAVQEQVAWDSTQACGGGANAEGTVVSLGWGGLVNPLNFKLQIDGVEEGKAASGLPATVRISLKNTGEWSTPASACTVAITSFALEQENNVGKNYRIAGQGTCSAAATPSGDGGAGEVAIGPFEFRSIALF